METKTPLLMPEFISNLFYYLQNMYTFQDKDINVSLPVNKK